MEPDDQEPEHRGREGEGAPEPEPSVRNEVSGVVGRDSIQANILHLVQQLEPPPKILPRGLPPAPQLFVNRLVETAELRKWVTAPENPSAPVVLVSGPGGVGSSAFAVQWGHRMGRDLYPDGTLYADLREHRADGGTAVSAVLAQFLKSCGWQDRDVPPDLATRLERFRSYTYDKKLLVVVDHVEHEAEVEALRPISAGSTLVATCHRMDEFVTGQRYLSLRPLDFEAARDLVSELIGTERAAAQAADVAELIELCGGVPKVLCLAVSRMRRRPGITVSEVVAGVRAELAREDRRVDGKSILDVVAARAYESLSAAAAWVYRNLGWHPGLDFAEAAIRALTDTAGIDADAVITELVDHHLLDVPVEGRFRLPSLVQAHARDRARDLDGDDCERQALSVWAQWYIARAQAADRMIIADRNRVFPAPTAPTGEFGDSDAARTWLDGERHNLLAMQRRCFELGRFDPVMRIAEPLWVLYIGGLYLEDWLESSRLAVDAAVEAGNVLAEVRFRAFLARALLDSATGAVKERMYAEAGRELARAQELGTPDGDGAELYASAIEFEGRLLSRRGDHEAALERYRRAREIFAIQAGRTDAPDHDRRANRRGVALQEHFIGQALLRLDELPEAEAHLRRAEALLVGTGHDRDVAKIRTDLGIALLRLGNLDGAQEMLADAVRALAHRKWYRYEAEALRQSAIVARERGDAELERACLQQVRDIYAAVHSPDLSAVDERLALLAG